MEPTVIFSHDGKEVTCYRESLNMVFVRDALGVGNELGCTWTVFQDGKTNVAVPDTHAKRWLESKSGTVHIVDP
jgi:hypothetical protein